MIGKKETVDYYRRNGMEAIDIMEAFTSDLSGVECSATYQVLKYMLRWKHKNGLDDLKKARDYLNRLIEYKESFEHENNKDNVLNSLSAMIADMALDRNISKDELENVIMHSMETIDSLKEDK